MELKTPPKDFVRMADAKCMECGRPLNAIGSIDSTAPLPKPGDPVACLRCGAVMTIEGGVLRGFTDAEMNGLVADDEAMDELAQLISKIHFVRHMVS